jgi:hypothetical protein
MGHTVHEVAAAFADRGKIMIQEALDQHAASLNRAWQHDRTQTVGASEIGQCIRKTFWIKNEGDPRYGVERDADYVDGWGAKMRGTIMENDFWAPAMKAKYGNRLFYSGKEQESFVSGFLSATPDGLIAELTYEEAYALTEDGSVGTEVMAECKSSDPRTNLDEAKPVNIFQTQVQMGLVRELTGFRPTHSVLSYMDASFWDQVKEFVIPFDPDIFEAAKVRAAKVMTATDTADLEPEGYLAGGQECKYCPFTKACGKLRMDVPKDNPDPIDPQLAAEFADYAREIASFQKHFDADEITLRTMKQVVKDRLREKKIRRVPGVISWSSVRGRKTYDNKAIQAAAVQAGVDIEMYTTFGEATDRLVIS